MRQQTRNRGPAVPDHADELTVEQASVLRADQARPAAHYAERVEQARAAARDTPLPPPLHELEEAVMDEIWRHDEICVREIMEALNADAATPRAYTTYMTIMSRLDGKGLLNRRREGKTDFYRPVYTRDRYADLRAGAAIDSVVDQFGEVALAHIARQMAQLDPQHRRSLQRLARGK
jgi:predicted transcriptional regulator